MPLPYTTTSPPPTSGALTVVDKANISSAPYGGGGGGGSTGPDLALSSITLNPLGNGVILGTGAGNSQSQIVWTTSVDGQESFQAYWRNGQSGDVLVNNKSLAFTAWSTNTVQGLAPIDCLAINLKPNSGSVPSGVIADNGAGGIYLTNVSSINGALPGGSVPPNLVVSSIQSQSLASADLGFVGQGGTIIFDQTGDQNIQFNNGVSPAEIGTRVISGNTWLHIGGPFGGSEAPVSISSLTCAGQEVGSSAISSLTVSSINGAAPGGGVGPVLGVSSLTASTVTFANVSTSGMFFAADGSLVNKAVGISLTPLTGQYGNSRVVGAWGEEVYGGGPGWAEFATQRLYVTDSQGAATNATYIQNIANTVSVNAPLISLNGPTSVSSLTVSSINGAAPGGGGGMVFSTVTIPGGAGSAFNSDPNVLNQVVTWPIIPNHVYNVNVDCRVQANAPTVTDSDNVYIEILPNGGTSQAMDTAWGVQVSTLTTGGVYTQVGGSALFKAPVNAVSTCALGILGSFSTTVRVDSITYVDMGVI